MLPPNQHPGETLQDQLEAAVKWEGVDLAALSALSDAIAAAEVEALVRENPTGVHARRIWFLYEWLTGERLDLPDARKVKAAFVLDPDRRTCRS